MYSRGFPGLGSPGFEIWGTILYPQSLRFGGDFGDSFYFIYLLLLFIVRWVLLYSPG